MLIGRQTLGEEYCDIIEVNGSRVTPLFTTVCVNTSIDSDKAM